jgi:Ca2+-binding RTX toxin-like protein/LysM repeat protein
MTTLTEAEKVIAVFEGKKVNAYVDSVGIPTIGSGFAMVIKVNGTWVVRSDLNTVLNAAGLANATSNDINILQTYASARNDADALNVKSIYADSKNQPPLYAPLSFTFNDNTRLNVLDQNILDAQNKITNTIGLSAWNSMSDAQQSGLISYVFQQGSVSNALATAILNKDYSLAKQIMSSGGSGRHISEGNLLLYGSLNEPGKYAVASGDTFGKIAQKFGLTQNELLDLNPDITNPSKLSIGQQINIPHHDGEIDTTSVDQLDLFDPYGTGDFDPYLILDPNSFWDFGQYSSPTGSTTNSFTISNSVGTGAGWSSGLTADYLNGIVASGTGWGVSLPGSVLNSDGLFNVAPSSFLSNGIRPGAFELSDFNFSLQLGSSNAVWNSVGYNFYNDSLGGFNSFVASTLGDLNNMFTNSSSYLNIDPLVLDLTGAGIQLNNYNDAHVLFNMDADEYKEQTGWIKNGTGFLVMDKNGDGVVNDVSEIFSEYFTSGAKNGLEALKTFDSNKDGVFNASDSAYTQVRVWQDTNNNGQTDAGELSTLDALGITSISLASTAGNGALISGNEVQATSTMVRNGATRAVAAVNFLTNPNGHEWDLAAQGVIIHSESGTSSFSVSDAAGATVNVATKGVVSAYGNVGNDTLIGDANSNWLGGGGGSDTLSGGAGDDVLIIDAEDLQANIDGGAGFDIVQVVGDSGVNFNLSQAHVELAYGGIGNDILVGGGTASVFIAGGAGDDIVIGSGANDALSGNDGDDMLDGGYGDDLARGGRGDDLIIGGFGNDIIDGGLGNDVLQGGDGKDVFISSGGNDTVDGGVGIDTVELSGEFSEYTRTILSDGSIVMTDKVAGRDGAVTMKNVEFFNFKNIGDIGVNIDNPMPSDDVININASGTQTILASTLLANDVDYQGNPLHITTLSDVVGGTASLDGSGNVVFTPTAGFNGVASFSYKIADSLGNAGSSAIQSGTTTSAEMKGNVTLTTASLPSDPLFADEWYLKDTNIVPVWKDYTGKGITVGVFETDIFDYNHLDLVANVLANHPNSTYTADQIGSHATLVAGVIGAARNGQGGVGVAYDAKLASQNLSGQNYPGEDYRADIENFVHYDVVNNSWGYTPAFLVNFALNPGNQDVLKNAVTYGRDGLGTVVVFGGGNDRASGGDANSFDYNASRFSIEVGAINQRGDIGSLIPTLAPFSNPGSSILVSAPGSNVVSTSKLFQNQDGASFGGDYETASGTSFATPIVSGVAALMLQANPNLGYRDIQKIFAYTAKSINDPNTAWQTNGATDWNGGGLHVSQDYGFGEVDALAAVRLAETWNTTQTSINEISSIKQSGTLNLNIPDGTSSITNSLTVTDSLQVEHVEVQLRLNHAQLGDLVITLIAPDGTKSVLLNRLDKDIGSTDAADRGYGSINVPILLNSTHDFGQNSVGTWQLKIEDKAGNQVGTLENWELHLYGQAISSDNTYIYTNEFATVSGTARQALNDSSGIDTINAAAVTTASVIDLVAGHTSTIAGRSLTIGSATTIENVYTGDGNDTITGNSSNNYLNGGRGNDSINGGTGNDTLDGGNGNDSLTGGTGADIFVIRKESSASDTITDFHPSTESDVISLQGFNSTYGFSNLAITQSGSNALVTLQNGQVITLNNVTASSLTSANFNFGGELLGTTGNDTITGTSGNDIIKGLGGSDTLNGGLGNDTIIAAGNTASTINGNDGNDIIKGSSSDDIIHGNGHNDTIYGNAGNDTITGDDGIDTIYGGDGADNIDGGIGNDIIFSGNGLINDVNLVLNNESRESDTIHGGDGDDTIHGEGGNENLYGDAGNDYIYAGNGGDNIDGGIGNDFIAGGLGVDNIIGGSGNDIIQGELNYDDTKGADDTIHGNDGDDVLIGGAGNDIIYGDAGNDNINGGIGDDVIYGGSGIINDLYGDTSDVGGVTGSDRFVIESRYGASRDYIWDFDTNNQNERIDLTQFGLTASDWNSRIWYATGTTSRLDNNGITQIYNATFLFVRDTAGSINFSTVGSDPSFQTITLVNVDANYLNPYHLMFLTNNGTYFGVDNVDIIAASDDNDIIYGNGGNDNLSGLAGRDQVNGGAGDDTLAGGYGSDILDGGAGNNTASYSDTQNLTGSVNPTGVTVNLQTGINSGGTAEGDTLINIQNITGSAFADTLTGDANNNTINGLDGNDTLRGGSGNDILNGGFGDDAIYGEDGDDIFISSAGYDVLNGGVGTDTVSYASNVLAVGVNLSTGVSTGNAGETLVSVENIIGSAFNDNLIGDANANVINGGTGADIINGGSGDDTITGGAGNDTINGGAGIDTVSYATSAAGVIVDFNLATQSGGDAAGDILSAIENLTGSAFGDTLKGNIAANTINAGDGNDYVYSREGDDVISGGNGDDTLDAGAGNDIVHGDAGNDTIYGQDGDDILYGDAGDDVLWGLAGNNILIGGAGIDKLYGFSGVSAASYSTSATGVNINLATNVSTGGDAAGDLLYGINNIIGSVFDDIISGSSAANSIDGGAGNDIINGGSGTDTINGGTGIDTTSYAGSTAGVTVNLVTNVNTGGDAQGDNLSGIENIIGSAFNDTLSGNSGVNVINGGDGNDIILGNGADTIDGGAGIDTVTYASFNNSIAVNMSVLGYQPPGTDILYNIENVIGTSYSDTIYANSLTNIIDGGVGGGDTIGFAGATSGVTVDISLNVAQTSGGDAAGDTYINFENLSGTVFDDILSGNSGANIIDSSGGNDIIIGGAGADTIDGGTGIDTASYAGSNAGVTVNLAANVNTGGDAQGDNLSSIENIIGSAFNDTLTALATGSTLTGGSGNDTLNGGIGNDTLIGGVGIDTINGGAGIDTVSYATSAAGVIVDINLTTQSGGDAAGDILSGIENITGSAFNDTLSGSIGDNVINSGDGNDTVSSREGNDTVSGGNGDDSINAGLGNDIVHGDAGNDSIYGRDGDDILYGDDGNDVIWGEIGNNILIGGAGADSLYGFSGVSAASYSTSAAGVNVNLATNVNTGGDAAGDLLYGINNIIGSVFGDTFIGNTSANLFTGGTGKDTMTGGAGADIFKYNAITDSGAASGVRDIITDFAEGTDKIDLGDFAGTFVFKGTSAFTGTAHEVNYAQVAGNTILGIDADGNGVLDFQIELTGLHTLAASDFLL